MFYARLILMEPNIKRLYKPKSVSNVSSDLLTDDQLTPRHLSAMFFSLITQLAVMGIALRSVAAVPGKFISHAILVAVSDVSRRSSVHS